jgi:hypothetical protein
MFDAAASVSGDLPPPDTTSWQVARQVTGSPSSVIPAGLPARICAMGVEAVNTSADLYRGGMAYAYRMPNPELDIAQSSGVAGVSRNDWIAQPASAVADITNLGGTYSGDARRGVVYVGAPDRVEHNPFISDFPSFTFYPTAQASNTNVTLLNTTFPVSPWEQGGIFLTGLAQNSSFVLKFRCFVEIAVPAKAAQIYQSLATTPSPISSSALEILTAMVEFLPAGFDYAENPMGEWFEKVLGMIAEVAPTIGKALGTVFPVAGIVGNAVGTGAQALKGITASARSKIQQAKQPKDKTAKQKQGQIAAPSTK